MDKSNVLRHTDLYDLIKQDGQIILIDLRCDDRRYLESKLIVRVENMQTDEFESWALEEFDV